MRELNLVLPGLLWPDVADADYLYPRLNARHFERLLAQANLSRECYSYSDFIYATASTVSTSLAQSHASRLGLSGFKSYLLVEPTHLRADRDRLLIAESELLQLNHDEAATIIAAVNQHFADELSLFYLSDELWLAGLNWEVTELTSYPIIDILGENVDDFLPSGPERLALHRLINEIQMLLYNLPLNQQRQNEGLLPVNSLWLWDKPVGGLNLANPAAMISSNSLIGQPLVDLAKQLPTASWLLIDQAYYPGCYRDSYAWLAVVNELDQQLAQPVLQHLRRGHWQRVRLWLPNRDGCLVYSLSRWQLAKFWRRAQWPQIAAQAAMV